MSVRSEPTRHPANILPDGQITSCFPKWSVQPLLQKYFRSGLTQITFISITVSFRQEGRSRVVTNAGRDAVDARASGAQWQSQGEMNLVSGQLACKMIGAFCGRQSRVVLTPVAGAKLAEAKSSSTGFD